MILSYFVACWEVSMSEESENEGKASLLKGLPNGVISDIGGKKRSSIDDK
jgi:hypothetical protein